MKILALLTFFYCCQPLLANEPPSPYYGDEKVGSSESADAFGAREVKVIATSFGSTDQGEGFTRSSTGKIIGKVSEDHTPLVVIRRVGGEWRECNFQMIGPVHFVATVEFFEEVVPGEVHQFEVLVAQKGPDGSLTKIARKDGQLTGRFLSGQSMTIERGRETRGVSMVEPEHVVR